MAKVINPLLSGDASGNFARRFVFRRGGVVTRMNQNHDARTPAQLAARQAFREMVMAGLTQEQADLLYAAIAHLHDSRYLQSVPQQDHGGLSGLTDDDHSQYFNQTRGDARYLQSVPQQDHGGLSGLGDDDHSQYFNQTRGDARYLQSVPQQDHGGLAGLGDDDHAQYHTDARGDARYSPPVSGFMAMYAGSSAPSGWLLCDGAAVSRTTYAALFAVLGSTYGAGNGSTTFNVPDMRGRVPLGVGTGTGGGASGSGLPTGGTALTARALGDWLGEQTHTLTTSEMPAHTHLVGSTSLLAINGTARKVPNNQDQESSSAGGGGAHQNMQPVMSVNFIIKT